VLGFGPPRAHFRDVASGLLPVRSAANDHGTLRVPLAGLVKWPSSAALRSLVTLHPALHSPGAMNEDRGPPHRWQTAPGGFIGPPRRGRTSLNNRVPTRDESYPTAPCFEALRWGSGMVECLQPWVWTRSGPRYAPCRDLPDPGNSRTAAETDRSRDTYVRLAAETCRESAPKSSR